MASPFVVWARTQWLTGVLDLDPRHAGLRQYQEGPECSEHKIRLPFLPVIVAHAMGPYSEPRGPLAEGEKGPAMAVRRRNL